MTGGLYRLAIASSQPLYSLVCLQLGQLEAQVGKLDLGFQSDCPPALVHSLATGTCKM